LENPLSFEARASKDEVAYYATIPLGRGDFNDAKFD
jgi:hypothetical protein